MVGAILHIDGNSTVHFSHRLNLDRSLFPPKPITVKMAHGQSYRASVQADIEAHIKRAIPMKEPRVVFEPMRHLVFAAPRTTVPALCVAACELVGGQRDQALAAASALLLIEAATYTHEHLPLTDRPNPGPIIQHAYGPNIELLTGDGIVPFGFELLARSDDPVQNNSERILRVIIEISRAVGSKGLIEGQYRKMQCSQSDGGKLSQVESAEEVAEKSEGGLHGCGAACGAVLGGGSEEEIEKLRKYGIYVGVIEVMLQRVERGEKGLMEEVEKVRNLAVTELLVFKARNVEAISSFINL